MSDPFSECPECGAGEGWCDDGACVHCGYDVFEDSYIACQSCGAELEEDEHGFGEYECDNCGAEL